MAQFATSAPVRTGLARYVALAPGVLVCLAIALVAIWLRNLTGITILSPVVVALVIGIAIRATMGLPSAWRPGTTYVVRPCQPAPWFRVQLRK